MGPPLAQGEHGTCRPTSSRQARETGPGLPAARARTVAFPTGMSRSPTPPRGHRQGDGSGVQAAAGPMMAAPTRNEGVHPRRAAFVALARLVKSKEDRLSHGPPGSKMPGCGVLLVDRRAGPAAVRFCETCEGIWVDARLSRSWPPSRRSSPSRKRSGCLRGNRRLRLSPRSATGHAPSAATS